MGKGIKILRVERSEQAGHFDKNERPWLKIYYKRGLLGRKICSGTIHENNLSPTWELSGTAEKIYGYNHTRKCGSRVYTR